MATAITILSNDGQTNLSAEVWAAFRDSQTANAEQSGGAPTEQLSAAQVLHMLADPTDWRLAVRHGDDAEVLERATLQAAEGAELPLRALTNEEAQLMAEARERANSRLTRVSDGKALPVASVGLISTAGGAFGFMAQGDKVARPGLMLAATGLGIAALVISLAMTYWLTPEGVDVTRLDRLAKRGAQLARRGAAAT